MMFSSDMMDHFLLIEAFIEPYWGIPLTGLGINVFPDLIAYGRVVCHQNGPQPQGQDYPGLEQGSPGQHIGAVLARPFKPSLWNRVLNED